MNSTTVDALAKKMNLKFCGFQPGSSFAGYKGPEMYICDPAYGGCNSKSYKTFGALMQHLDSGSCQVDDQFKANVALVAAKVKTLARGNTPAALLG